MATTQRHALLQTWRSIAARPRCTFQTPIFHFIRTIASSEGRRRHSIDHQSASKIHRDPKSSDPIPFVHLGASPVQDVVSEDILPAKPEKMSTLTDKERDAFSRLIDMSTIPAVTRSASAQADLLAEIRRSPQERDDEVLALLGPAGSHSPRTESDPHVSWRTSVDPSAGAAGPAEGDLTARMAQLTDPSRSVEDEALISASGAPGATEALQRGQRAFSDDGNVPFLSTGINAGIQKDEQLAGSGPIKSSAGYARVEAPKAAPLDPIASAREEQYTRVGEDIRKAQTDHHIWKTLDTELFSTIEKLELDVPHFEKKRKASVLSEDKSTKSHKLKAAELRHLLKQEKQRHGKMALKSKISNASLTEERRHWLATIGPNYPLLLHLAAKELRQRFRGSTLAFSIIPTIKALGRSSYVLGASTGLYNELISAAYTMYCDFNTINTLLIEIENAGLEFDLETLDILDKIRMQGNYMKQAGGEKQALRLFWATDIHQGGWRKVITWVPIIKARLQQAEARRAEELTEFHVEDQR